MQFIKVCMIVWPLMALYIWVLPEVKCVREIPFNAIGVSGTYCGEWK